MNKKFGIIFLLCLVWLLFLPSAKNYVNAQGEIEIYVKNFSIPDKVYDKQKIDEPIVNFFKRSDDSQIMLTKDDYKIRYDSGVMITSTLPETPGTYVAEIEILNPNYLFLHSYIQIP